MAKSTADYLWVGAHYPVWAIGQDGPTPVRSTLRPLLNKHEAHYFNGHRAPPPLPPNTPPTNQPTNQPYADADAYADAYTELMTCHPAVCNHRARLGTYRGKQFARQLCLHRRRETPPPPPRTHRPTDPHPPPAAVYYASSSRVLSILSSHLSPTQGYMCCYKDSNLNTVPVGSIKFAMSGAGAEMWWGEDPAPFEVLSGFTSYRIGAESMRVYYHAHNGVRHHSPPPPPRPPSPACPYSTAAAAATTAAPFACLHACCVLLRCRCCSRSCCCCSHCRRRLRCCRLFRLHTCHLLLCSSRHRGEVRATLF
jgi:hypothetical protein